MNIRKYTKNCTLKQGVKDNMRNDNIDDAKAIAIYLMVLLHTGMKNDYVSNVVTSFHMPLSFIVSGMFFKFNRPLLENINSIFRKLLVPYLLFSIISLSTCWIAPYLHPDLYNDIQGLEIFKEAIIGVFFWVGIVSPNSFLPNGALWFLLALIIVKMSCSVIAAMVKKKILVAIILSIAGLVGMSLLHQTNYYNSASACMAMPFFALGFYLRQDGGQIIYKTWFLIILTAWVLLLSPLNGYISMMGLEYGRSLPAFYVNGVVGTVFCIVLSSTWKFPSIIHEIGRNSIVVLGLHHIPLYFFRFVGISLMGEDMLYSPWICVPASLLSVLACLGVARIIESKIPFVLGRNNKVRNE